MVSTAFYRQVESPVSILLCSFLFKEGLADILAKAGTSTHAYPRDLADHTEDA